MELEDYLKETTEEAVTHCFQASAQSRRRFEVWTIKQRYIFSWMHVVHVAMNLGSTELSIELTQTNVFIKGIQLELIYQALLKEALEWVQPLPQPNAFPPEVSGPFVKTIIVEPKGIPRLSKPSL